MPSSLGHMLGDLSISGGMTEIDIEEEKKEAAALEGVNKT